VSVLSIQSVSKSYGRIQALNQVSFDVPEGSVFGILGPNGSGKTTLLSIILDVLHADSGQFLWFGKESSPDLRKKIGSLLETPNFYHYLSAVNNLKITQRISTRGDSNAIDDVLHKVNLHERKHSRFSTYSLGMKQRLAIAGALLGSPKVMVLDEPTNGLDPVGIAEIRSLIQELNRQGHTIIMASHLLDEVEKVCTHVTILNKGKLITTGMVDEVMTDEDMVELAAPDNTVLFQALHNYPGLKQVKQEGGHVYAFFGKGHANTEEINAYCHARQITLSHLLLKKKRLEARFFELTGNESGDFIRRS
jgi:ABC-2 type transport system ATP-binding protein